MPLEQAQQWPRYDDMRRRDHHRELLETLTEDIASFCFEDPRVANVELTLDKPDMFSQTESVGVRLKKARD